MCAALPQKYFPHHVSASSVVKYDRNLPDAITKLFYFAESERRLYEVGLLFCCPA
jgi:hypothetical protein